MFHEASPQCILTTVLHAEKFILFVYCLEKLEDLFLLCIEKCKITDYRRVEKITTIAVSEDLMNPFKNYFLTMLLAACFLSGCYITPVRHLASDIALVQVGQSTREDVLVFLGDPDEQQVMENGVEKWLYIQTKKSTAEKTPFLGKYFGTPEVNRVVVTFTDGIVTDSVFSSNDKDEFDWADDYSWQKKN